MLLPKKEGVNKDELDTDLRGKGGRTGKGKAKVEQHDETQRDPCS